MNSFTEYLPYLFALLIAASFFVMLRKFVDSYIQLKDKELRLLAIKSNGANKLQAYERMTLFLERIKPANFVNKFEKTLKPHEFTYLMEKSINEEFDYNASQQLYISKNTWQNIVTSKNSIIQLAHQTYENMSNEATLEEFKTVFLMNYVHGEDYISQTIDELRKEALMFNN